MTDEREHQTIQAAELERALVALLQNALEKDVRIEGLTWLSGGASRQSWSFDAVVDGASMPLILQSERPEEVGRGVTMAVQARVLRAAHNAGAPVARVIASNEDVEDDPIPGEFMVVERLEGETIPRKILRDERFTNARTRLTEQCASALARIHTIPPEDLPELERGDELAKWRAIFDDLSRPHPVFELAFRWLEQNRPPQTRSTVVHGDFRHGNLVIGPDGLRAVLDWELVHAGDPLEDLGWLCVKSWRFGAPLPVGGFGTYEELFGAYERESGHPVDPGAVRWWEVFGTLRWGIICIIQSLRHLSGAARSVELATIGRRVCETEYDLLNLLADIRSRDDLTRAVMGWQT